MVRAMKINYKQIILTFLVPFSIGSMAALGASNSYDDICTVSSEWWLSLDTAYFGSMLCS